jgi:DNA-binding PadR family transcriptional regulator
VVKAFLKSKSGRPPKDEPHKVGPLQEEILRKIASKPSEAHGIGIARALRHEFDPNLPDAQVYVALRRLEARGIIELVSDVDSTNSPSESNRPRGRRRKIYALTMSGKRAISDAAENSKSEPGRSSIQGDGYGKYEGAGAPA